VNLRDWKTSMAQVPVAPLCGDQSNYLDTHTMIIPVVIYAMTDKRHFPDDNRPLPHTQPFGVIFPLPPSLLDWRWNVMVPSFDHWNGTTWDIREDHMLC